MGIKNNDALQTGNNNQNGGRRNIIIAAVVVLSIIGIVFGAKWIIFRMQYTSTEDAQVDTDLIQVSSKVPGRIVEIYVSEGDNVKKGQKLAQIDQTDYRLALEQAKARLESARRDLEKAESALELTQTKNRIAVQQTATSLNQSSNSIAISTTQQSVNLEKLKKDVERADIAKVRAQDHFDEVRSTKLQADKDLERAVKLFNNGVVSKEQYDRAQTNAVTAEARLSQIQQELSDTDKQLDIAKNNLKVAEIDQLKTKIANQDRTKAGLSVAASKKQLSEETKIAEATVLGLKAQIHGLENAVDQAQVAMDETTIVSPVDGTIAKKISMKSEIVAAGKLIFYVEDFSNIHVTANIEETKLYKFKSGSDVKISIDAIPGKTYRGKVGVIGVAANSKFSLIPSGSTTGQFIKTTQRIPVKIYIDGDLSGLKAGMNVIASIKNNR